MDGLLLSPEKLKEKERSNRRIRWDVLGGTNELTENWRHVLMYIRAYASCSLV